MTDDERMGEGSAEAPPSGEEGPADEGQHDTYGEKPQEVGEAVDEPDTPLPDEDESTLEASDRLHVAMTIGVRMGLVITSTTGGRHGAKSYHYSKPYRWIVIDGRRYQVGRAADVAKAGNPDALYKQYFHRIEPMRPTELFYDPMGYSWKNGQRVGWTVGGHRDHVHVAF